MALTSTAQIHKLEVILEELDKRLGLQDSSRIKWNVKRESCSWQGFGDEATSEQMFCSGNDFKLQEDLVLARGCHVSLHQLWGILVETTFADIMGFCFNLLSVFPGAGLGKQRNATIIIQILEATEHLTVKFKSSGFQVTLLNFSITNPTTERMWPDRTENVNVNVSVQAWQLVLSGPDVTIWASWFCDLSWIFVPLPNFNA